MADLTIRPTLKLIKLGAAVLALIALALDAAYLRLWRQDLPAWSMAVPFVLLLWPAARALRRRYTVAVISADRLRYETGAASRSTRTIQLGKIQDVRVQQSMTQRMFNIGDLSIETAGESSRLTMPNVESPQAIADELTTRAQQKTAAL